MQVCNTPHHRGIRLNRRFGNPMHLRYSDITNKLGEPVWYTTEGYPRYCDIEPGETGVYSVVAVFWRIRCVDCNKRFTVGAGWNHMHLFEIGGEVAVRRLRYGDPPMHDCPGAGETMLCDNLLVTEWWHRLGTGGDWERVPEKEIEIGA